MFVLLKISEISYFFGTSSLSLLRYDGTIKDDGDGVGDDNDIDDNDDIGDDNDIGDNDDIDNDDDILTTVIIL